MTVYVEMYDINDIVKKAKDAKKIAILGCYACVNSSLAYNSESGITHIMDDQTGQFVPHALLTKMAELAEIFRREGKKVVAPEVLKGLACGFEEHIFRYLTEDEEVMSSDTIVALVCPAGVISLRKLFPHHRFITTITPPMGVLCVERELVDNGRVRRNIPGTARFIETLDKGKPSSFQ